MKTLFGFSICLIVVAGILSIAAVAQITPSDDAYTLSSQPTTNFGAKNTILVESSGANAFVRFDLSGIPSSINGSMVAKGTLKIFVATVTTAGSFNVDLVTSSWNEKNITADNSPTLGGAIASAVPVTTADKNQYVLVDVTAAVVDWLNGTANDGLALVPDGAVSFALNSKETTTTSHPAELDIVLSGPAGPPGSITGVTAGSGLTGGGTQGNVTVSMLTSCASGQILQWNGSSWVCSAAGSGTITGVTAGTDLTGGGTGGKVTLNLNTTATDTRYAQLGAANTFGQAQTINGKTSGLTANASDPSGVGVLGFATATGTGGSIGVEGVSLTSAGVGIDGFGTIGVAGTTSVTGGYGVKGGSTGGTAVYGQDSAAGMGVEGVSTSGTGVYGFSSTLNGVYGNTTHGTGVQGISGGDTINTAGVFGRAGNGTLFGGIAGVWGDADQHVGVFGSSNNFPGVAGQSQNSYGVQGVGTIGVTGTSNNQFGYGVAGFNNTIGGIGVYGHTTGGGPAFYTDGNVQQTRTMGGWIKAMAYVDPFAPGGTAVTRCFNSQSGSSTAPCNIGVTHLAQGVDRLDFVFQVNDRFLSVVSGWIATTCVQDPNTCPSLTNSQVVVATADFNGGAVDAGFWVVIY